MAPNTLLLQSGRCGGDHTSHCYLGILQVLKRGTGVTDSLAAFQLIH